MSSNIVHFITLLQYSTALVGETMSVEFEMFEAINESVDYHSTEHVARSISGDDKEIQ